jgi:hypothetical protein
MGLTIDQTSAWAALFYFCSRVTKPNAEAQPLITCPKATVVWYLIYTAR